MAKIKWIFTAITILTPYGAKAETITSEEYTVAPKFREAEEYTYQELSRSWRRTTRDGVDFVRLPTSNASRTEGPCGTTHYNPDLMATTPQQLEAYKAGKTKGFGFQSIQEVGSYVTDTAACMMMVVAQEWTKECEVLNKDKNVCALSWGDSAHRDEKEFKPHSVKYHGFGECIDLRPIRKGDLETFKAAHATDPELPQYLRRGDYKQWPISHGDDFYDREKTYKLLMLLKEKGGKPIFFIDPKMRAMVKEKKLPKPEFKNAKGHENHIHVCFADNKQTREFCKNFRYKRSACGPPLY